MCGVYMHTHVWMGKPTVMGSWQFLYAGHLYHYIHPHITKTLEKRISCPSHGKNFQKFSNFQWKVKVLLYPILTLLPLHRQSFFVYILWVHPEIYMYTRKKYIYSLFTDRIIMWKWNHVIDFLPNCFSSLCNKLGLFSISVSI